MTLKNILKTLEVYEQWIGQVINKDKSTMFLSNKILSSRKQDLLHLIVLVEGSFPTKYFDAPLFLGRITT